MPANGLSPQKRRLNLKEHGDGLFQSAMAPQTPWPVLVVDDDIQVHAMTRVLLRDYDFEGRSFEILSAHSGTEARAILAARRDIPVMLLDVVMETDDAGLSLARHVRQVLGDKRLRIILRTGQPGEAPERRVMLDYDINDYRSKTELTAQKLFTAIVASLRAWTHIDTIERMNATLEARVAERTRELEQARAFAERLVDMLPSPVWFKDEQGHYRLHNRAFRNFFAIDETAAIEATVSWDEDSAADADLLAAGGDRLDREATLTDATGATRALILSKAVLRTHDGRPHGIIGIATDITERKTMEGELRRLATMDPLTGAWNRRHFMAAAAQEMERAARYGSPLSAIMIDVDFFKAVNDGHGHGLGDEVLRRVVEVCRIALREVDLFGRLGGEEFAVLLPETALSGALGLAERLRHAVAELETGGVTVTASLGVAQRHEDEIGLDGLLGRADQALYRAKQNGRNRVEHASQG